MACRLLTALAVLCLAIALARRGKGLLVQAPVVATIPAIRELSSDERLQSSRLHSLYLRAPGRLISIGDVHGDALGLRLVLAQAGLIDRETHSLWTGGNATLVQTGDVVDRGDDSASALRLLVRLQAEARRQGGNVVGLMGNHELMQVVHDFRFVTDAENDGYGGSEGARALAFSPQGEFGPWLRTLPVAVVIEQTKGTDVVRKLFVHAGLDAHFLDSALTSPADALLELDRRFAGLLGKVDADHELAYSEPLLGELGPLWNRVFAMHRNETLVCHILNKTLTAAGADKMIVGHTVVEQGPTTRCDGRLVLGDVGFSPYYSPPHGNRLALEHIIEFDGSIKVIRAGAQTAL